MNLPLTKIDPTKTVLLIDVSRWQGEIDWPALKAAGVAGVIAKVSQGNYLKDSMFAKHHQAARAAGLLVGAYVWDDPNVSATSEVAYALNCLRGYPVDFVCLDVEHYWAPGSEPWLGPVKRILLPGQIESHAREAATLLANSLGKPVPVYTGLWFIKSYAPGMSRWLSEQAEKHPTWIAWYVFGKFTGTWQQLMAALPSKALPNLGTIPLWLWQIGEGFTMPGYKSSLDVNVYLYGQEELLKFCGRSGMPGQDLPPSPVAEKPLFKAMVFATRGLNVRTRPLVASDTYAGITLKHKTIIPVYETRTVARDVWYRVKINDADRWICADYHGQTFALPAPQLAA